MRDPLSVRACVALARAALVLYPPSFRREMGEGMLRDVRERAVGRAEALGAWRMAGWMVRLAAGLGANAAASWFDGRRALPFSWLDAKLGLRMLRRHPGLTLAGGFGIAVGVAIGVGFFTFSTAFFFPHIPLPEGDRLIALENWDTERGNEDRRSLFDFGVWRDEMTTVEDMTAFIDGNETLVLGDAPAEHVSVAIITPSGFRLAQVPPLMGRTLVEDDVRAGAPRVVVVGHDFWQNRLGGDPGVVGSEVQLGTTRYEVVGVMPPGFAFPMSHQLWAPLRIDPVSQAPGGGPPVFISGRKPPGVDLDQVNAELTVIERRMAAEYPETHARMRAQAMPYVHPLVGVNEGPAGAPLRDFILMQSGMGLVLLIVCVNVAALVYARTAARAEEIAVRSALGAGRVRIITQLFAESLVLASIAAVAGLGLARIGMGFVEGILYAEFGGQLPFWMDLGITPRAAAYAAFLTILTAVITGVVPGLQATGRKAIAGTSRTGSGTTRKLGKVWTFVIAAQVAIAVGVLPVAGVWGWWQTRNSTTVPHFETDRILQARVVTPAVSLETDAAVEAYRAERDARVEAIRLELERRLLTEPGVERVDTRSEVPLGGVRERVTLDGPGDGAIVRATRIGPDFGAIFDVRMQAGRIFDPAEWDDGGADVALVNASFARELGGGGSVLGRRIHAAADPNAEPTPGPIIVGVVEDLRRNPLDLTLVEPRIFRPMREATPDLRVLIRTAGDAAAFAPRLRAIVHGIDPTLRVAGNEPLSRVYEQERFGLKLVGLALGLITLAALSLSAAGIYALMSFTVTGRRREIGVRTALGAQPRKLVVGVFLRALRPLVIGAVVGVAAVLWLDVSADGEWLRGLGPVLLPGMVTIMALVGAVAAWGPVRRGLAVEVVEALRAE